MTVDALSKIQKALRLSGDLCKAQDKYRNTPDLLERTKQAIADAWLVTPT